MYKNVNEVAARLEQKYDGPIETRQGNGGDYSYVPWHVTKRLLDEVFGPFGWSTTAPHSYFANGTYNSEFGLSATVQDEDGSLITKTVPAQGQAVARGENDDNALKSAQSDALSRGAKLFGDAFGFYLYEQKRTTTNRSTSTRSSSGPRDYRPSDKQLGVLHKLGLTDTQIAEMPGQVWKAKIDEFFATKNSTTDENLPF